MKEDEDGYKIYIKENVPLNRSDREACKSLGINDDEDKKIIEAMKPAYMTFVRTKSRELHYTV